LLEEFLLDLVIGYSDSKGEGPLSSLHHHKEISDSLSQGYMPWPKLP